MKDQTKEIKIYLPIWHFRVLQLWAFVKSVPFSQLAGNIVQARCEDSHNLTYINDAIAQRAGQNPYNTTPDLLKNQIWNESPTDFVSVPLSRGVFERLEAIAQTRGISIEDLMDQIEFVIPKDDN